VSKEYRRLLIAEGMEQTEIRGPEGDQKKVRTRKGMSRPKAEKELERLSKDRERDLKISQAVRCRIRYFSDGAVIGSKGFVNAIFERSRDQFSPKRKDGARKPRGALSSLEGELWSLRDLKESQ